MFWHFIYDDIPSDYYDVIACYVEKSIDGVSSAGMMTDTTTQFAKRSNSFNIIQQDYKEPIKFTIQLINKDATHIDKVKERDLKKWLCKRGEYHWMQIQGDGFEDLWMLANFSNPKFIYYGGVCGLEFEVITSSPFMFSPLIKKKFEITNTNRTANIYIETDDDDYIYPNMKIIMKQSGTLNIKNSTEVTHRDFCIEELGTGEIITIDGSLPDIESSSPTHSSYSVMNMSYEEMNYGVATASYDNSVATTSTSTKTYLYNCGDECTSLTGGWKIESKQGVGTIKKNSDHIYMFIPKSNNPNLNATAVEELIITNTKPLALYNYSKLYMKYSYVGYNNQNYNFQSGTGQNGTRPISVLTLEDPQYDYMSGLHNVGKGVFTTENQTEVTVELFDYENGSAFSGGDIMYYNGIQISLSDYNLYEYPSIDRDLTLKIHQIWFDGGEEPEPEPEIPTIVEVTSVTLNTTTLNLTVGETSQLLATVLPTNATNKTVTWSTANASIATVSGGLVTAIGEGMTTITAQAGSKKVTCTVIVNAVVVDNPNIWKLFNKNWIRFVDGKNTLTFDKNCTVEFEYREVRKVGVLS